MMALICVRLSFEKCTILGQPTLIVPSPSIGCIWVGRLYIEVGCWGGFPGCLWDMDATMTRPFSSGELRTTTGCCPIVLWRYTTSCKQYGPAPSNRGSTYCPSRTRLKILRLHKHHNSWVDVQLGHVCRVYYLKSIRVFRPFIWLFDAITTRVRCPSCSLYTHIRVYKICVYTAPHPRDPILPVLPGFLQRTLRAVTLAWFFPDLSTRKWATKRESTAVLTTDITPNLKLVMILMYWLRY